jgi:hypothetical protein
MNKNIHKGFTHIVLLLIIAVVVLGGVYGSTNGDFLKNSISSLAAVSGTASTTTAALTVTSPNGDETWVKGSTHTITWTGGLDSWTVDVLLKNASTTNTVVTIASSTSNKIRSVSWKVPTTINSRSYNIRIKCTNCPTGTTGTTDLSDAPFIITAAVTAPDLTANAINASSPRMPVPVGQAVTLSGSINNIGTAAATNVPSIFQVMDEIGIVTYARLSAGTTTFVGAGATNVSVMNAVYTPTTPGTYLIRLCANMIHTGTTVIAESNITNNCGLQSVIRVSSSTTTVLSNVTLNGTPSMLVTTHAGSSDTYTAAIPFKVTAGAQDVWIANKSAMSETPLKGYITQYYATGYTGIANVAGDVVVSASGSTANDSSSGFKVPANGTRTFTLKVSGTGNITGLVGYKIIGIGYDTDSTVDSGSPIYSAGLLTDLKTPLAMVTAAMTGPIDFSVVSKSAVSDYSNGPDTGTFKVLYKLTAGINPIYVSRSTTLGVGTRYFVQRSNSVSSIDLTKTPAMLTNLSTSTPTANGNYRIGAGQSQTFELKVTVPIAQIGIAEFYRLNLGDIYWDTDDDATPDQDYILPLIRTDYLYLDNG